MRVTGDSLRIRQGPGLDWEQVGIANAGDLVYIGQPSDPRLAPRLADGYEWYPVEYATGYSGWPLEPEAGRITGYMATGSEAEAFVELEAPDCSASADDLEAVVAMTPYERVACLGDRQLTLEGTFGCPFCDSLTYPVEMEPAWLAEWTLHLHILAPGWSPYPPMPGSIVLVTPPGTDPPAPDAFGRRIHVTGHFDDSRAAECTIAPDPGYESEAPNPEATEWYCRERFVVESWEDLGPDPDFEALIPG